MIFCILGKSGVGKDTIANRLLELDPSLNRLVPYTTRPMRPKEKEGREYHFVNDKEAFEDVSDGKVIELREYEHYVDGTVYYYTKDNIEPDKDYIYVTTPDAFEKIKEYYKDRDNFVVGIYLDLNPVTRLERCFNREQESGGTKYEELIRRFLADENDYTGIKELFMTSLDGYIVSARCTPDIVVENIYSCIDRHRKLHNTYNKENELDERD